MKISIKNGFFALLLTWGALISATEWVGYNNTQEDLYVLTNGTQRTCDVIIGAGVAYGLSAIHWAGAVSGTAALSARAIEEKNVAGTTSEYEYRLIQPGTSAHICHMGEVYIKGIYKLVRNADGSVRKNLRNEPVFEPATNYVIQGKYNDFYKTVKVGVGQIWHQSLQPLSAAQGKEIIDMVK